LGGEGTRERGGKMKHIETHRFKRGQKIHLDSIYSIQSLGDQVDGIGHWWEADEKDGDDLTITQDIVIRIEVRTPSPA